MIDTPEDFYRLVDEAVAKAVVVTPTAAKSGKSPRWPYVPVIKLNLAVGRAKTQQIRGKAFATREAAISYAARHIERLKERYRHDFLAPERRALRLHYGLPAELPNFLSPNHEATLKMKTKRITENDLSTLANICRVAAERFDDHAKEFRRFEGLTPPEGSLAPTGEAAARLAAQFEQQAAEARAFAGLFDASDSFVVSYEGDEAA